MEQLRYGSTTVVVSGVPTRCPLCHTGIAPTAHFDHRFRDGGGQDWVQIVFSCPARTCREAFIATYLVPQTLGRNVVLALRRVEPQRVAPMQVAVEIEKVSPSYKRIAVQAHAAEGLNLDEVCGAGYRRALEFLIKDFAIMRNSESAERIRAMPLAAVISEFIPAGELRDCAARTAWLGNDEVHYTRVWKDKDLGDLKQLLLLTEAWVTLSMRTADYTSSMPNPQSR